MLLIYFGKSAAGKTTFCKEAIKRGYKPVVTYTTRPMRENETDGVDYHFVTKEKFLDLFHKGDIIESRQYNTTFNGIPDTWYYGCPRINPKEDQVLVADIEGIMNIIESIGRRNIELVYIEADDEVREARAKARGSFSQEEWDRRLLDDNKQFSCENIQTLIHRYYRKDLTVINNNDSEPVYSELHWERIADTVLLEIVNTIIEEGTSSTETGNWLFYYDYLGNKYGLEAVPENIEFVKEALEERDEVLEVIVESDYIDVMFYIYYCPNAMI